MSHDEYIGRHIALSLPPIEFASYEIWNFLEQNTKVAVDDMSVFRNVSGEPTGVVVAVLRDDISLSRLKRLTDIKFKNVVVEPRLFASAGEFRKFVRIHADTGLENTRNLTQRSNTVVLYVAGFGGTRSELKKLLSKCGKINVIDFTPKGNFFTVYFASEESAKRACHTFDGTNGLTIVKLYQRAAEASFVVRGCPDLGLITQNLSAFGNIADIRVGECEFGVIMETLDAAKATCALLKCSIPGIATFFVDKFYIEQMTPVK